MVFPLLTMRLYSKPRKVSVRSVVVHLMAKGHSFMSTITTKLKQFVVYFVTTVIPLWAYLKSALNCLSERFGI